MLRQRLQYIATIAVAFSIAVLAGCGSTGSSPSSAPSTSPPSVTATPTSADFGAVLVGTTASRTVALTNSGGNDTIITAVNTSDATFGVSGLALPATISPGGSTTLSITVTPSSAGPISGSVSFVSNAT